MLQRAALLASASALAATAACGAAPAGSVGADASVQHAVSSEPAVAFASTGRTAPCGWEAHAAYQHVIWIWMENRSYDQILGGTGKAIHLASYARACGTATNYDAVSHPSLPNYIAATSGGTHGISDDCDPSSCSVAGKSLFGQLGAAGSTGWASYAENMTHPCDRASYGRYAARHNPAVYYTTLRSSCLKRDLAMGGTTGRFAKHLAANDLPGFTFITPNLCDDGHDCATATADSWLGYWLGRITTSPLYRGGTTAVFITWDENDYSAASNQVATVVIAPTVAPGTRSHQNFTHFSLLRTTEDLLHVGHLGAAAHAPSMRSAFNL